MELKNSYKLIIIFLLLLPLNAVAVGAEQISCFQDSGCANGLCSSAPRLLRLEERESMNTEFSGVSVELELLYTSATKALLQVNDVNTLLNEGDFVVLSEDNLLYLVETILGSKKEAIFAFGKGVCCSDIDQNRMCDPQCVDNDFDGYGIGCFISSDCNDDDPNINSGRIEQCNGKDDNCNTFIDEDVIRPPADNQNGICSGSRKICRGIEGWKEPIYSRLLHYELVESRCDSRDNDCDGKTDEGNFCQELSLTRSQRFLLLVNQELKNNSSFEKRTLSSNIFTRLMTIVNVVWEAKNVSIEESIQEQKLYKGKKISTIQKAGVMYEKKSFQTVISSKHFFFFVFKTILR